MKRRTFITLLSGAAAAWPLAARAQQSERMRRIGVLIGSADNVDARALFAEFQQALEQLGWTYGRNIQIDIRWGSDPERIIAYAKELVRLSPDVIFAGPTNVPGRVHGRALGTILDPKGKALVNINKGEAFNGEVDILGKPYVTGYDPIKDASGKVIGIWYVGYEK